MKYLKVIVELFQASIVRWGQDKGHLMAAALSYYMIFALAPMLVISINIAGAVFGEAAVEGQLMTGLDNIIGPEAAAFIQLLVENAQEAAAGRIAAIVGIALLLYGASNVFYQLKMALNIIWRIDPEPENGVIHYLKTRSLALFMVLTLGFLFLLAFALIFALTTLDDYIIVYFPQLGRLAAFYQIAVIFPMLIVLVALLFKMLPDAHVAWRDVWFGAAVTALFLMIGIQVLSLVVGRFITGSIYGAAGSLIVVLYFVYYSAQILFFGAEFTQVYSNRYGSKVRPSANAVILIRENRNRKKEPFYPMPVYTTPSASLSYNQAETTSRRIELKAALGLLVSAVFLLIAFLLGRKSS
ncbi:MAG: YihY/virulence factor BrkB family protein [Chloroflexi bacterium]|nr:YihY/virulence factor BrkB family protein [Chloroflexota bacterium]